MSCDRNKCYQQEYNRECCDTCEECMEDAPHEYCCKIECGEHKFADDAKRQVMNNGN